MITKHRFHKRLSLLSCPELIFFIIIIKAAFRQGLGQKNSTATAKVPRKLYIASIS